MKVEIEETHITVVLKNDGSEEAAGHIRNLLHRIHEVERQWEKELGENSAFLVDPVRFDVGKVVTSFHQTGKKLKFADET